MILTDHYDPIELIDIIECVDNYQKPVAQSAACEQLETFE